MTIPGDKGVGWTATRTTTYIVWADCLRHVTGSPQFTCSPNACHASLVKRNHRLPEVTYAWPEGLPMESMTFLGTYDKEVFATGASFDELFEHFVDSDPCGLSDRTTDRSVSEDWNKYYEIPDFLADTHRPVSPVHTLGGSLPFRPSLREARSMYPNSFGEAVHLETFDGSQSPPDRSAPLFIEKTRPTAQNRDDSLPISKPLYVGVSRGGHGRPSSPKLSRPSASQRRMQSTWAQKIEANTHKFGFRNARSTSILSPSPSAPLQALSWNEESPFPHGPSAMHRAKSYQSQTILPTSTSPAHAHYAPLAFPVLDNMILSSPGTIAQSPQSSVYTGYFTPSTAGWDRDQSSFNFPSDSDASFNSTTLPNLWDGRSGKPTNDISFAARANHVDCTTLYNTPMSHPFSPKCGLTTNGPPSAITTPPERNRLQRSRSFWESESQLLSMTTIHSGKALHRRSKSPSRRPQTPANPSSRSPSPHSRRTSRASSSHRHHRRSRTAPGTARSSTSSASMGFVNYTPDDSRKILTGVAPSGSSKTKARREREAEDRRRRLSMAAAKAVLEAGGDVEELRSRGFWTDY